MTKKKRVKSNLKEFPLELEEEFGFKFPKWYTTWEGMLLFLMNELKNDDAVLRTEAYLRNFRDKYPWVRHACYSCNDPWRYMNLFVRHGIQLEDFGDSWFKGFHKEYSYHMGKSPFYDRFPQDRIKTLYLWDTTRASFAVLPLWLKYNMKVFLWCSRTIFPQRDITRFICRLWVRAWLTDNMDNVGQVFRKDDTDSIIAAHMIAGQHVSALQLACPDDGSILALDGTLTYDTVDLVCRCISDATFEQFASKCAAHINWVHFLKHSRSIVPREYDRLIRLLEIKDGSMFWSTIGSMVRCGHGGWRSEFRRVFKFCRFFADPVRFIRFAVSWDAFADARNYLKHPLGPRIDGAFDSDVLHVLDEFLPEHVVQMITMRLYRIYHYEYGFEQKLSFYRIKRIVRVPCPKGESRKAYELKYGPVALMLLDKF